MPRMRPAAHRKVNTARLTAREVQVLALVAEGNALGEVAAELSITTGTVSTRLDHARDKLQARSRPAMVHAALVTGELTPPDPAPAPETFTESDRGVWTALATLSTISEIAAALSVSEEAAKAEIRALIVRTGARDQAHLVYLGHGYGVLDTTVAVVPALVPEGMRRGTVAR
ncbi:helix-turn-helix transcriptional regulator [Streptomyces olivoreticuli]